MARLLDDCPPGDSALPFKSSTCKKACLNTFAQMWTATMYLCRTKGSHNGDVSYPVFLNLLPSPVDSFEVRDNPFAMEPDPATFRLLRQIMKRRCCLS